MKYHSFQETGIITNINNNNPLYNIKEKEFDQDLLKFGALISILQNKKVNQTTILLLLLENETYIKCFKLLSDVDNTYTLLYNIIIRYPILCKSKIINSKIKEIMYDKL
jgi:hypothetical protein